MTQVYTQNDGALTDKELIEQSLKGNRAAFDTLVRRYKKHVFGVAWRVLRNHEEVEDAVQEALLCGYRNLSSFRGDSAFSTWLCGIAVNTSRMRKRSEQKHIGGDKSPVYLSDIANPERTPEDQTAERELLEKLFPLLEEMRGQLQTALLLRSVYGFSYEEIGRRLGLSTRYAKRCCFEARKKIRTLAPEEHFLVQSLS